MCVFSCFCVFTAIFVCQFTTPRFWLVIIKNKIIQLYIMRTGSGKKTHKNRCEHTKTAENTQKKFWLKFWWFSLVFVCFCVFFSKNTVFWGIDTQKSLWTHKNSLKHTKTKKNILKIEKVEKKIFFYRKKILLICTYYIKVRKYFYLLVKAVKKLFFDIYHLFYYID